MLGDGDWGRWRFELTAHGEYVELSFEDIRLRTRADVDRWASELRLALRHFTRRVDMLLDLRGLRVTPDCAERCAARLADLFERHAASVSHFGAEGFTYKALEPCLSERSEGLAGHRSRRPAYEHLMRLRSRRLGRTRTKTEPNQHWFDENGASL